MPNSICGYSASRWRSTVGRRTMPCSSTSRGLVVAGDAHQPQVQPLPGAPVPTSRRRPSATPFTSSTVSDSTATRGVRAVGQRPPMRSANAWASRRSWAKARPPAR